MNIHPDELNFSFDKLAMDIRSRIKNNPDVHTDDQQAIMNELERLEAMNTRSKVDLLVLDKIAG